MKRSTRRIVWEKRARDYAVGVIRQRGKPDTIVVKIRKGSDVQIAMDTVPSSINEPKPAPRAVNPTELFAAMFGGMNQEPSK